MAEKLKNKIVITGGSGFIGRNLINKLLVEGFKGIVNIDRHPCNSEVNTVIGDFSDKELLNSVLEAGDVVVHLACSTIPATSEINKEKDIQENIIGTVHLLDVCSQKKVDKIIFLSSGGTVYGDHGARSVGENDTALPINAHGIMKLTVENYIRLYKSKFGLNYLIIRAANPYGRHDNLSKPQGAVDVLLHKALGDEEVEIWGDGKAVRDYIHISDLVDLVYSALSASINDEIINAGTGVGASLNDVMEIIEKESGKELKKIYLSSRGFDLPYNVLQIDKAKKLLNWQAKISLADGIALMISNLKKTDEHTAQKN